jgi:predicted PurR-regulated permease PerM
MTTSLPPGPTSPVVSPLTDSVLRIGMLIALVFACVRVMAPFIVVLLWATVLAVVLHPLHARFSRRVGNRWSAVLIGLLGVTLLVVPLVIAVTSVGNSVFDLVAGLADKSLVVPPPPARLASLPLFGDTLTTAWSMLATNMPAAIEQYGPMLKEPALWLASFGGGLLAGVLSFVLAVAIAAVMIAYGAQEATFARDVFARFTGSVDRGARLVTLTAATIRGVAQGVVGVAVVQSLLIGIGFFAIGMPTAGLLTLLALLIGIIQVPALLITLPAIAYIFATRDTTPAVIFAIYITVAGLSDNILKPLMLGRGLEVPMPVILIGVIGGMLSDGLVGLFVGPVLLAVGYVLFLDWLSHGPRGNAPAN